MSKLSVLLVVVFMVLTTNVNFGFSVGISDKCLQCICDAETNCDATLQCEDDGGTPSCGPYKIKKVYWLDCGKPGNSFEECAKDYECSKKCVRAYMKRYGGWKCTNTCQDYARMHVGGPMGCTKPTTLGYWDKIKEKGCNENS